MILHACENCGKETEISSQVRFYVCKCGSGTREAVDPEYAKRSMMCLGCKYRVVKGCALYLKPCTVKQLWNDQIDPPELCPIRNAFLGEPPAWRNESLYPETPSQLYPSVDVIIPFHSKDSKFLAAAVESALMQELVDQRIHVVADSGAEFPPLRKDPRIVRYRSDTRRGPYVIANAIVRHHSSGQFIAILDADDIMSPGRLWKQASVLDKFEMTSAAVENFVDATYTGFRQEAEPVIFPWVVYSSCPRGRMVNTSRMLTRGAYQKLNGFGDMICSADFDIDNRALFAGMAVHGSPEILGRRRLHPHSLTNGAEFRLHSKGRMAHNDRVMRNIELMTASPNISTAALLGALDSAVPLTVL